jgi:hypothetical protein
MAILIVVPKMPPTYTFTDKPYSLTDIKLGALVANITQPSEHAHAPPRALQKEFDFTFQDEKGFNYICNLDMESPTRARLTRLLTIAKHDSKKDALHLHSKQGRVYELTQPCSLFQEFCGDVGVRNWLISCVEGGDTPYFITGLRTFTDAKLADESELEQVLSNNLKWPNSTAGKMVDGVTGTRAVDSCGDSHRSKRDEQPSDITSERIYAISARKIGFKWFSRDELEDQLFMTKNSWSFPTSRIGENASPKMNVQVVEVSLGDEAEPAATS